MKKTRDRQPMKSFNNAGATVSSYEPRYVVSCFKTTATDVVSVPADVPCYVHQITYSPKTTTSKVATVPRVCHRRVSFLLDKTSKTSETGVKVASVPRDSGHDGSVLLEQTSTTASTGVSLSEKSSVKLLLDMSSGRFHDNNTVSKKTDTRKVMRLIDSLNLGSVIREKDTCEGTKTRKVMRLIDSLNLWSVIREKDTCEGTEVKFTFCVSKKSTH